MIPSYSCLADCRNDISSSQGGQMEVVIGGGGFGGGGSMAIEGVNFVSTGYH